MGLAGYPSHRHAQERYDAQRNNLHLNDGQRDLFLAVPLTRDERAKGKNYLRASLLGLRRRFAPQ